MSDPIRAAIATYFESINGEDWERLATLFHDDAVLIAPGTPPRRGGDGVASYYGDALRPYPVHSDEATREIYAGDIVTVEIRFDGELANGRAMTFDAVDVFDFVDGRIKQLSSWYDSAEVRRLLLDAATADPPADRSHGSLSEVTPARRRWAIGRARRGQPYRLDPPEAGAGVARWEGASEELLRQGISTRALLLDVEPELAAGQELGPEQLAAAAARQGTPVRPGDVLLVRTADSGPLPATASLAGWLSAQGVAALATDAAAPERDLDVVTGSGWWLEALHGDATRRGGWDGLLVSVPAPAADGGAAAAGPMVFT